MQQFRALPRRRGALALLVLLLLLQGLTPGIAAAAARSRNVELVVLCTVYGLRTVALKADGAVRAGNVSAFRSSSDSAPPGDAAERCALGAFPAAGPAPDPAAPPLLPSARAPGIQPFPEGRPVPDASRTWWSRLKQAPPAGMRP